MRRIKQYLVVMLLAVLSSSSISMAGQDQYSNEFLSVKRHFSGIEVAALAEVFEGVRTSTGKEKGLFPIRKTGVSTAPIVLAAKTYLSLLSTPELVRTQFAVDDPEWRRWFNVDNGIYARQGISLKEMNDEQREAAWGIIESSLSTKGFDLSRNIMKTDRTLSELNGHGFLDEAFYFLTIMGNPDENQPWGWQLDGHHLVINYFVMGDQVVMTPSFFGAEPAVTTTGKYAGNAVLQTEQDMGLAFMLSLPSDQQKNATLESRKTKDDMLAGAHQDNLILDYAGLQASKLEDQQSRMLLDLIEVYVSNLKDDHATIRMEEVLNHLNNTWFAWVGDVKDNSVFYYRIHSPVILIEFDHQIPVGTAMINEKGVPTRDHIHAVIRTPNGNDYGKDLLEQHLNRYSH